MNRVPLYRKLLRYVGLVIVAFALSYFVAYDPFSISYFAPMEKMADYSAVDFYQMVADRRSVKHLEEQIAIVAVDSCSRSDIADLIERIDYEEPAVIGIDILFDYESSEGEALVSAINACESDVVLPLYLHLDPNVKGQRVSGSFFYDQIKHAHYGAVNLAGNSTRSIIREFRPWFAVANDTIPHFVTTLAQCIDSQYIAKLRERNYPLERISYSGIRLQIHSSQDVFDGNADLRHKVVLLGTIHDFADFHITPIEERMPGVLVQGLSLSTIFRGAYLRIVPDWVNRIVGIILCFVFIWIKEIVNSKDYGDLLIRVVQLFSLYLIVLVGYGLFVVQNLCFDLTFPLLMIALALLALDLSNGVLWGCQRFLGLYRIVKRKIINK